MAKKYKITSPESSARYAAEEGTVVELELNESDERAQIAAGWVEEQGKADNPKEDKG